MTWPIANHHDDPPMTHTRPAPSPSPPTHASQPTTGCRPRRVPPPPPLPPAPLHATLSLAPHPVACHRPVACCPQPPCHHHRPLRVIAAPYVPLAAALYVLPLLPLFTSHCCPTLGFRRHCHPPVSWHVIAMMRPRALTSGHPTCPPLLSCTHHPWCSRPTPIPSGAYSHTLCPH